MVSLLPIHSIIKTAKKKYKIHQNATFFSDSNYHCTAQGFSRKEMKLKLSNLRRLY